MSRFDDILGAAGKHQGKNKETLKSEDSNSNTRTEFWDAMEKPERAATIKLSVSVPLALNEKIEEKARTLGISKNELINKMLTYLLE
ncbi:ribbon-helix-helix domain-containing protein [Leptothoe sp. PORK10 BA2]|uniref:ribbon-helix-helix domain-containing protein n=1 Tax=Leptothoe sp. PORK10 BA2 TaxID=3110254 RepID=UPI002B2183C8|nr:ribbon-helix-helix domain-containing protein [Leptothoe sp. PORK10 BA2]MEA5466973.1 ribbon-helix-helix domain-containing protein [Leptothoe sp. PORK10 BA2]